MTVPLRETIDFIVFLLGWHGGYLPIYLDGQQRGRLELGARTGRLLTEKAIVWDRDQNRQIEIGLPSSGNGPAFCTALWCWLVSPDAVTAARRFKPPPSLVLQVGKGARRLVMWGLSEKVSVFEAQAANKRLAYRLGAVQKHADPDLLRIPLPGTCMRLGRSRPAPVRVTRAEVDAYTCREVAGGLREPPRPYMDRLRAGEIR